MTYVPNSLNQYDSVGGVSYAYDGNGNLSSDGRNAYTYDEENRLTTLVNAQHSTQYEYDALNRRVSKKVDGAWTYFVLDGAREIAEYNASGQLQAEYVYGDSIDEVLVMSREGKNYYYHYDGLGSVSDLTDSSGNVVESYTYGVYGRPSQVSSVGNPFMFTGRRFDDESGLYYYRLRMYDPKIGRFLQRDPIGYYDSMNLFEYCFNNPTNWVDPWGLEGYWDDFWQGVYQDLQKGMEYLNQGLQKGMENLNRPMCKKEMAELAMGFIIPGGGAGNAFRKQLERQLLKDGPKSIFKSLRTITNRLSIHEAKVAGLKFKSSVQKEIENFREQIETLKQFIKDKGL